MCVCVCVRACVRVYCQLIMRISVRFLSFDSLAGRKPKRQGGASSILFDATPRARELATERAPPNSAECISEWAWMSRLDGQSPENPRRR